MSRLPDVTFIEGEPPPQETKTYRLLQGWVAYVIAHLEARPGEWAKVDAEHANTVNVKSTCKRVGVDVDVRMVNGTLYMRLNQ